MFSRHADRMIAELLDDPMIQMLMRADRVDRQVLVDDLRQLACRLDAAGNQTPAARREAGCCLTRSRVAQTARHVAAKINPVACGAFGA
jgi:hypothetical protein